MPTACRHCLLVPHLHEELVRLKRLPCGDDVALEFVLGGGCLALCGLGLQPGGHGGPGGSQVIPGETGVRPGTRDRQGDLGGGGRVCTSFSQGSSDLGGRGVHSIRKGSPSPHRLPHQTMTISALLHAHPRTLAIACPIRQWQPEPRCMRTHAP